MELSAVLTPAPEGGYVAFNPETGTTTQGETVEEFPTTKHLMHYRRLWSE